MNLENEFPLRYWLNGRREVKKRHETEWRLEQAGVTARRFALVDEGGGGGRRGGIGGVGFKGRDAP